MKATIQSMCKALITGLTNGAYERVESASKGTFKLITGAALSDNGEINVSCCHDVIIRDNKDISRFTLEKGDVVLISRGNAIRAGFVSEEIAKNNIIASAHFILIKPNSNFVLGEVLTAYLNSPQGQDAIVPKNRSAMLNVSLSSFKAVEFNIPQLNIQKEIAELFFASNDAYRTTIAFAEQQKKFVNGKINQLIAGKY